MTSNGLLGTFRADRAGEYTLALTVRSGDRSSDPDYTVIRVEEGEGEDDVTGPPLTNACGEALEGRRSAGRPRASTPRTLCAASSSCSLPA